MNKFIKLLSAVLCAVVAAFTLVACADCGAPKYSVDNSGENYVISAAALEEKLTDFLTGREDRTSFSDAEAVAADYLCAQLLSYGYNAQIMDISVTNGDSVLTSQNVAAVYNTDGADENTANVIIGAYYDNWKNTPYKGASAGTDSDGALSNATGVAALLAIAEYLMIEKPSLDFNVTVVFFGASATTTVGAEYYYEKQMTQAERRNTVLMIELQRLGADHVYAFSDARSTERESFFDRIAQDNELDIYKISQKSPVMTNAYALSGVPYYQWAHNGVFPIFFNKSIPTLNLISGNWESFDLSDAESATAPSISNTADDNIENLKALYPDYADKMAIATTLVIKSLTNGDFIETMAFDRENFPNTDILMKRWIWYLVVFCVIVAAAVCMSFINNRLAAKYPITVNRPKRMKMAVFGMDYEDKNSNDIFIDIKNPNSAIDDIFPGIPNNDSRNNIVRNTAQDDIFPIFLTTKVNTDIAARSENTEKNSEEAPDGKKCADADPVSDNGETISSDHTNMVEDVRTLNANAPSDDGISAGDTTEEKKPAKNVKDTSKELDEVQSTDEVRSTDHETASIGSNSKDADKSRSSSSGSRTKTVAGTAKRTSAASTRKTVSAGKSTGAKKTERKPSENTDVGDGTDSGN